MRSDPLHRGHRNRQPVTCPLPTDSTETPRPDRRTPPTMRTFKDTDLFGDVNDAHRECCQCCSGYCPETDVEHGPETPTLLARVTMRGVEYVTDKVLMVLADRVELTRDPWPDSPADVSGTNAAGRMTVPDAEPGPSLLLLHPSRMACLLAAGLNIREGGVNRPQHVYDGQECIGWLMPLKEGDGGLYEGKPWAPTLATAPQIDELARALPVVENRHPWETAAALLAWEAERAAARVTP